MPVQRELMIKAAVILNDVIWLVPANEHIHPWACKAEDEFQCLGVVIETIKTPYKDWWTLPHLKKIRGVEK